jgi:hypothetical protein
MLYNTDKNDVYFRIEGERMTLNYDRQIHNLKLERFNNEYNIWENEYSTIKVVVSKNSITIFTVLEGCIKILYNDKYY